MSSSQPPPVYSRSEPSSNQAGPPPAFESGPSAPPVLADSKHPLDEEGGNSSTPDSPSLPLRVRAPGESSTDFPPPQSYNIGSKVLAPFELVTIPEIRAHLSFLGAFARLKAEVKSQKGPEVRTGSVDELWAIYIARAVDRFALWVKNGLGGLGHHTRKLVEDEVPPLDVLMAWHTYMLNPRVYYEDGVRGKSQLLQIRYVEALFLVYLHILTRDGSAFPLNLVDRILEIDTLSALHPSPERQHRFESLTGQPWAAPLNTTLSDTTHVQCPRCKGTTLIEVCWVTSENTGFAQHGFKARCHVCMGVFDRNVRIEAI
jgi:hypothetical protein